MSRSLTTFALKSIQSCRNGTNNNFYLVTDTNFSLPQVLLKSFVHRAQLRSYSCHHGKSRIRSIALYSNSKVDRASHSLGLLSQHRSLSTFQGNCNPLLQQESSSDTSQLSSKLRCTLIPGDGVGPELCLAVKNVLSAISVPIEFDEYFLRYVD